MPATPSFETRAPRSPEEQARTHYNDGVRALERADELSDSVSADAARQGDPRKREKLRRKASQSYSGALRKFARATELQPTMHEAWNYLGYSHRKLGNYAEAMSAYDRALALKPGYPEAIEYRAHAYLGLNRIADAKQAYLELFAGNRTLAASLLAAMQEWVGEHRGGAHAGATVDVATLDSFASWVTERRAIASQTAGLTRAGAAAAWREN
jgi:tetratricopeptide (TPR) repeat protein